MLHVTNIIVIRSFYISVATNTSRQSDMSNSNIIVPVAAALTVLVVVAVVAIVVTVMILYVAVRRRSITQRYTLCKVNSNQSNQLLMIPCSILSACIHIQLADSHQLLAKDNSICPTCQHV